MGHANLKQESEDYIRVASAIEFIEDNFKSQPSLDEIAKSVFMSKYHFDRVFKRWAGISPIRFLQFITLEYTKNKLSQSKSVLDTAYDAGLSGPGRLHDLFVNFKAMSPGEYKSQAAGVDISYGFSFTPFGECLLATTDRGICYLGFTEKDFRGKALDQLFLTWPGANFNKDANMIKSLVKNIFNSNKSKKQQPFNLFIKGTNFQITVWKALLSIPEGWVVSYQDIASYIGHQKAFRAVANAIAINPIAYLIPCHRVITKSGKIHRYRYGSIRKKALIGREAMKII